MKTKEMSKEELELLSNKDLTNLLLTEKGKRKTAELYKEIIVLLELPKSNFDSKIGDYYTSLTTDKRFVLLEDGTWDLKSRYTSDRVVVLADDEEEEFDDIKDEDEEGEEVEEGFDSPTDDEDEFDDNEDDLKDLVVLDEDELELEQ